MDPKNQAPTGYDLSGEKSRAAEAAEEGITERPMEEPVEPLDEAEVEAEDGGTSDDDTVEDDGDDAVVPEDV